MAPSRGATHSSKSIRGAVASPARRSARCADILSFMIRIVPAAAASKKLPLVVAMHGNGDTNANFLATSGLEGFAASKSFVLAAPQGITQTVSVGGQTIPNVDWDAYRAVSDGNIDLPL